MKNLRLKKKVNIWILCLCMIITTIIPTYANEPQTPQISNWALGTLNEGENYGIFPVEWYYDGFQEQITPEKLQILLQGVDHKLASLELKVKKDYTKEPINKPLTRRGVIEALFATLAKYEDIGGSSGVDYFKQQGLLSITKQGLELDSACTTQQAVVLAIRFVEHTYKVLDAGAKGFAWQVNKGGNTVYLLGSIHVGTSGMYPLNNALKEAFSKADTLVVEANILTQNEQMNQFIQMAMYADGTTIKDHISKETYDKLVKVLTTFKLPENQMGKFKPWSIANDLNIIGTSQTGTIEDTQEAAAQGADMYFLLRGMGEGKSTVELEGLIYQGQLFDNLSEEYQEDYLNTVLDSILNPATGEKTSEVDLIAEWQQDWIAGDIEGFKANYTSNYAELMSGDDELTQMLFGIRDKGMAEKITKMLEQEGENTYFVVVGAGHFTVEGTILDQLKEKGYEVKTFYQ